MKFFEILVWPGGGLIGLILWAMSMGALAIIVQNLLRMRRSNILPDSIADDVRSMFENKQFRDAIDHVSQREDMLSEVLRAGLSEAPHGYGAMERAMEDAADERRARLLRRVEWLNLIGNVSPMLGLLGTVWGMILAFGTLERTGIPEAGALAGSIKTALVTTLLGLAVAIPSLAVYGTLRNRIDGLSSETMLTCQELLAKFRPGKKQGGGGAPQNE
ncbi:MAG: MotA/TolQ/ExbB proton channel family protein [Phycisphaerae bacterium]